MAKSNSGHKPQDVYREADVVASADALMKPSFESSSLIGKLFETSEATDFTKVDPHTMSRLLAVVKECGHLEFCSAPVCEQLVAAVVLGSLDDRANLLAAELVRTVAALLYQDFHANARLTRLWNKLKEHAA